ncbi:ashwin isoform X2 [Leucoraja erinacea]|uniref:ashwin isoform X2 n=1 Tax=Leucoraja erinaceus TaxID=7782 RepID=UPI0024566363|nr:ashwin isoform X2 [Leucoraja erinacea]
MTTPVMVTRQSGAAIGRAEVTCRGGDVSCAACLQELLEMAVGEAADGQVHFDCNLLMHPELLSGDFLLQLLKQREIPTENLHDAEKDQIVEVYIQHVIPLPQRELPKNRWGRKMVEKRKHQSICATQSKRPTPEVSRKRPLIVFDGSSTSTKIKLKKNDSGTADLVQHPPAGIANTSPSNKPPVQLSDTHILTDVNAVKNPVRGAVSTNGMATMKHGGDMPLKTSPLPCPTSPGGANPIKLKRALPTDGEGDPPGELSSADPKRKIQHVTWP